MRCFHSIIDSLSLMRPHLPFQKVVMNWTTTASASYFHTSSLHFFGITFSCLPLIVVALRQTSHF